MPYKYELKQIIRDSNTLSEVDLEEFIQVLESTKLTPLFLEVLKLMHSQGWEEGEKDGYKVGKNDGYRERVAEDQDAAKEAFSEGYREGKRAGYDEGYTDGRDDA